MKMIGRQHGKTAQLMGASHYTPSLLATGNWAAFFGAGYKNRAALRAARFGRKPLTSLERWRRRNAHATRRSVQLDTQLRARGVIA